MSLIQFIKRSSTIWTGLLLLSGVGCTALSTPVDPEETLLHSFSNDLKLHQVAAARQDLFKALSLDPKNPITWNNLAYLDFSQHHYHRAEGDLAQGLAESPGNPSLLLNQARLLLAESRYQSARIILLNIETLHPWPRGYRLLLAIADLHTGHSESARTLLVEILSSRPSDHLANLYLSRIQKGGKSG